MIITLKNADFSKSNIGTLSTWRISRSLGSGAVYSGVTSVEKGAAFTGTITLAEGYEIGTAGISVTMGGVALSDVYSVSGNVITISIPNVTGNVLIKVPTVNITTGEEFIDKTVEGIEVYIADNADTNIKNIKMYGKAIDSTRNLVDVEDFAWMGVPGFINSSGIWTPTSEHATQKTFAITQMKIPVIPGHIYTFANIPHADEGAVTGIHWFDSSYNGVDINNTTTVQNGWISRNATARVFSATVVAPENAAYCEMQLSDATARVDNNWFVATTEGLLTSLTNANTTFYHIGAENLFDVEEFAWAGAPGYLDANGVWIPTAGQEGDLPRFVMTNMKIPVIAGCSYTFNSLPIPIGGRGGIHWFDSTYTGINTADTTTKQNGWISRDVDKELFSGTFVAPENAAYCELQIADTTVGQGQSATTTTLTTTINNAGIMLYENITGGVISLGTLYVNNIKTIANSQTANLSSVNINTEADYVYKKSGVWYVNVNGVNTALDSNLQTALNSLKLSTSTGNYIWGSNGNYLSVTYSVAK